MAETTETVNSPTMASTDVKKFKKQSSGVKKRIVKTNHPPTAQMVDSAIKSLKERGGSSLLAIKKYLAINYKVDADKLAPFIKKYLKSSVEGGHLIQTKGKGASGSFKLSAIATKTKKEIKMKAKLPKVEKKIKKIVTKKTGEKKKESTITTTAKKSITKKKKTEKSSVKSVKKVAAVKTKTPKQKSTKPSKTDAKNPKTPKPKKVTSPKKATIKKLAKK